MPTGLAAVAEEAEDPRSVVVAQVSFWWHGGIGIRVIRCVPQQRRLAAEPC